MTDTTYNGWTNYETWNVSLWIQNDEGLNDFVKGCTDYNEVIEGLYDCGSKETPDGVKWNDPKINRFELNEMLQDLWYKWHESHSRSNHLIPWILLLFWLLSFASFPLRFVIL